MTLPDVGQIQGGASLALAAGAVALWATFIPCFLWIFLAAPWLEQIAARPRLGAAMKGISAAVVGVILNLSVWFALHVLFGTVTPLTDGMVRLPVPALDTLDLSALALTVIAAGLMGWRKLGMIPALATLALCGMAQHLL